MIYWISRVAQWWSKAKGLYVQPLLSSNMTNSTSFGSTWPLFWLARMVGCNFRHLCTVSLCCNVAVVVVVFLSFLLLVFYLFYLKHLKLLPENLCFVLMELMIFTHKLHLRFFTQQFFYIDMSHSCNSYNISITISHAYDTRLIIQMAPFL